MFPSGARSRDEPSRKPHAPLPRPQAQRLKLPSQPRHEMHDALFAPRTALYALPNKEQRLGEIRDPSPETLMRMIDGFRVTAAIHVAAVLGIADLLAAGPRSSEELAAATSTHAESLYRLLSALAALGLLVEGDGRMFTLSAAGELLRSDHPRSLAAWARFVGGKSQWLGWGELEHAIRTGESSTTKVLGMPSFAYRAKHPETTGIFDAAMTSMSNLTAAAVVEAYDFAQHSRIADVGGGRGALLAAILTRFPRTRGILFDQAHVVAGAGEVLRAAGVAGRVDVVPGSFFETAPVADCYVLQHILHDWSDEQSVRILQSIRQAAPIDARVLIIERTLGDANEDPAAKLSDLNMLVALGVGRERTAQHYERLLNNAGFELVSAQRAATHEVLVGAIS